MATDSITTKQVTIGTSVVLVAQELIPTQRKSIVLINASTGGQTITVYINGDAATGVGIPLSPGGTISDSADGNAPDSYFPPSFQYTAISSGAGGVLAVIERVGSAVK